MKESINLQIHPNPGINKMPMPLQIFHLKGAWGLLIRLRSSHGIARSIYLNRYIQCYPYPMNYYLFTITLFVP